ncbi:hypothetical protein Nepgr_006413 [Nepenthes gracilis]|uniref:Uncharacterized protein n=1 Tax=Nepenthes gracilis TaxID=150966 RepID=A0AAD3XHC5_NEPGR|nr:hypothetical protein Nepgr_006413 [Nepenthes gracilis]
MQVVITHGSAKPLKEPQELRADRNCPSSSVLIREDSERRLRSIDRLSINRAVSSCNLYRYLFGILQLPFWNISCIGF